MIQYEFTDGGKHYVRINKAKAKREYERGTEVIVCPCNLRPFTMWHCECVVSEGGFDRFVNEFEFYACLNSETGRKSAFYMCVD